MEIAPYLPAITAALTLANTLLLFLMNRQSRQIRRHVNGMQLQLLAEAERRGRREALQPARSVRLGE